MSTINFTERQECPCARCSAHRKQWAAYAESVAAPGDAQSANAAMPGQFNMSNAFAIRAHNPEEQPLGDILARMAGEPIVYSRPLYDPVPHAKIELGSYSAGEDDPGAMMRRLTPEQKEQINRDLERSRNVAMPGAWLDQDQAHESPTIPRHLRNLVWFLFGAACITVVAVIAEIVAEVAK